MSSSMSVRTGGTIRLSSNWVDWAGADVDPSTLKIEILDDLGVIKYSATNTTKDSVGHYHYDYTTPVVTKDAVYLSRWTATISGENDVQEYYFTITVSPLATVIFRVTPNDIKLRLGPTVYVDADILTLTQKEEYGVCYDSGVYTDPGSSTTQAAVLQAKLKKWVELQTCIAIANTVPHSQADGSHRVDHYPILNWTMELNLIKEALAQVTVPIGLKRWGEDVA